MDPPLQPARVVIEHRDRYLLQGADGPLWAWPPQGMRRKTAHLEKPGVGDWVAAQPPPQPGDLHHIHAVLERRSALTRQAAGERAEPQLVAANLDTVFIVTSMNLDFNPRRLERYLTVLRASGAAPVILLNKADLVSPAEQVRYQVEAEEIAEDVPVILLSALSGDGVAELAPWLGRGRSVGLIGSSGVGKSTLVNRLLGGDAQEIGDIRAGDDRGRHTTTHREMFVLPHDRGVLLDTPGMRELQLWTGAGLEDTFPDIEALAEDCRYRDCRHNGEPGCAIAEALEAGTLSAGRWESYSKLLAERTAQDLRRSTYEQRRQDKRFGRMVKEASKHRKKR